jgi:murein DD-endopeptidase MepM/ murein hydrolase activator NlpD
MIGDYLKLAKYKEIIISIFHSPFAIQIIVLSWFVIFMIGFRPQQIIDSENYNITGNTIENGFMAVPIGLQASWQEVIRGENGETVIVEKRRKYAFDYYIVAGDNISKLAQDYNLKSSTLLWANDLTIKDTLQIGETILIPPTDGVYYRVKDNDILSRIAKKYKIPLKVIREYNSFRKLKSGSENIRDGDIIFLAGAKKELDDDIKESKDKIATEEGAEFVKEKGRLIRYTKKLVFQMPTKGIMTQSYHKKHRAWDIANKLNTPIYAAESGTVVESSDGWNYGYGSHVVVDHGGGWKTMYAHMHQRKIKVGSKVKKGQIVGLMGNSGRVFGPTGIHLHFEIRKNKYKVNPWKYLK